MKIHIISFIALIAIMKILFKRDIGITIIFATFIYITSIMPWLAFDFVSKIFKKKSQNIRVQNSLEENASEKTNANTDELTLKAINEKRKTDPLIGAKFGGKALYSRLVSAMQDDRGVHVESLLCALGSLAGYACQASIRAQSIINGAGENSGFITAEGADGKSYFFGDPLNQALYESKYSVWSIAAGSTTERPSLDVGEIFEYVANTVGSEQFGIPRTPDNHTPGDLPINYLKAFWPKVFPDIKKFCKHPVEWPVLAGVAIQAAIDESANIIPADVALKIIMESAIPMSKIDISKK